MSNWRGKVLGDGDRASRPIIWVIGFFAFLNVYSMQAVLPLVMQDFKASPVQAGMTVGSTVLAIALVSPFMGMLSDAIGRKLVLSASMLVLTLPTALIPMAQSLSSIIVLRFIQGLAVPGIVVVVIAYIAEEFRQGGVARMTSTYVSGTVVGGFSGRFLAGHTGEWLGWRGAFWAMAALNLLGALMVVWLLPASRNFVANRDLKGNLQTLRKHLANRRLWAVCAVGFCVLFSLVGCFTYVNLYLAFAPFHLSPASLANVFGVYLFGAVVTPFAARLTVRYGFLRSLLAALAVSMVGLFLTLVPSLPVIVIGLAICSSGVFICQSSTISHISARVTEGRSLATGLYYMSYYAGGGAASWLAGLAFEREGWHGSVAAVAVFQCLAAVLALVFLRTPSPAAAA